MKSSLGILALFLALAIGGFYTQDVMGNSLHVFLQTLYWVIAVLLFLMIFLADKIVDEMSETDLNKALKKHAWQSVLVTTLHTGILLAISAPITAAIFFMISTGVSVALRKAIKEKTL